MKSAQQRAESAARALRREGFFQPHPALDSEAASLILRETGIEGLVGCLRNARAVLMKFKDEAASWSCDCHGGHIASATGCHNCKERWEIESAINDIDKLTPPKA